MSTARIMFLDLDGPLLDVRKRYHGVYAAALKELGPRPLTANRYWGLKRRNVPERAILARSGGEHLFETYQRRRLGLIEREEWLKLDALQPGTLGVLDWLQSRLPIVLVSLRSRRRALGHQLEWLGLCRRLAPVLSERADRALGLEAIGIANGIRTPGLLRAAKPAVLLRFIGQLPGVLKKRGV